MMAEDPGIGVDDVIIPVVAECDDSYLSESRRMQVSAEDVAAALAAARASAGGPAPAEGAVGSGTGMSCLGFKGGIGSSSRLTPDGHVVGALVMSNFGGQDRLTVDGVPVGRMLPPEEPSLDAPPPAGSCIVVTITDAPLGQSACARLARRSGLGLARTGSVANHGSGEIFLALATGLRAPRDTVPERAAVAGEALNPYFAAAVEATEEAVLNSMLAAPTVTGRGGHRARGLPADKVRELLIAAGRLPGPHPA
jgi:D-aminopeptidase